MTEEIETEEDFVEEAEDLFYCLQDEEDDSVVIKRELKYATFEYNETEKTITIETKSEAMPDKNIVFNPTHGECCEGECVGHKETDTQYESRISEHEPAVSGRIKLNAVYSFALLRFVIRIAQRNWFRKVKK
jgi:hypothetical protein